MLSHHERSNMAISKSGLPAKVLQLFDPREDLEYKPAIDKKKPVLPLLGLAGYVGHFPDPDDPEYQPPVSDLEQKEDRKFRSKEYYLQARIAEPSILERRTEAAEQRDTMHTTLIEAAIAAYDPKSDPQAEDSDPMKTLFVSRLDFSTTDKDLYAEFERHGPVRSIKLVRDQQGKSRGYAFVEYQHTGDMKTAYKAYPPDGFMRIGNTKRWSVVDVERGRTVPDWRPMRLGGGKGGDSRLAKPKRKDAKAQAMMAASAPSLPGVSANPAMRGAPRRPEMDQGRGDSRPFRGDRDRDRGDNGGYPPRPSDRGGERYGSRDERGSRDARPGGGYSGGRQDRYGGGREDRFGGNRDRASYVDRGGRGDRNGGREDDRYGGGPKRERGDNGYGAGAYSDRGGGRGGYGDRGGGGTGYGDRGGSGYGDRGRDAPRRGDDRDVKRVRYDDRERDRSYRR